MHLTTRQALGSTQQTDPIQGTSARMSQPPIPTWGPRKMGKSLYYKPYITWVFMPIISKNPKVEHQLNTMGTPHVRERATPVQTSLDPCYGPSSHHAMDPSDPKKKKNSQIYVIKPPHEKAWKSGIIPMVFF